MFLSHVPKSLALVSFALLNTACAIDASARNQTCLEWPVAYNSISKDDWQGAINGDGTSRYWKGDTTRASITNNGYLRMPLYAQPRGSNRYSGGIDVSPSRVYTLTQTIILGGEEGVWSFGGKNKGGKIGYGLAARSSTDTRTYPTGGKIDPSGATIRIMWRGGVNSKHSSRLGYNHFALYMYNSDRKQNIPFGDDLALQGYEARPGVPATITMEVGMNSAPGKADGWVKGWVDGRLSAERRNIVWTSAGERPAVIDRVFLNSFYGGKGTNWSPQFPSVAEVGNVCWQPK